MPENHRAGPHNNAAGSGPANAFAEFLNPNSMITPGAAGAFTMVITNTLCQQFAQLPLNYTGLAVSFMFGTMVLGYGASFMTRMIYFLINSLVIFVVANGSNAIGVRIASPEPMKVASIASQPAARSGSFGLASADKTVDNSADKSTVKTTEEQKSARKPSFFRQW